MRFHQRLTATIGILSVVLACASLHGDAGDLHVTKQKSFESTVQLASGELSVKKTTCRSFSAASAVST